MGSLIFIAFKLCKHFQKKLFSQPTQPTVVNLSIINKYIYYLYIDMYINIFPPLSINKATIKACLELLASE